MPPPSSPRWFPDPNASRLRSPWLPSPVILENMERPRASGTLVLPTAATGTAVGGLTLPAGVPITGVAIWSTTAGATYTIRHFELINLSRVVLERTANATANLTANSLVQAPLQAVYTPLVDTPVYVVISVAATTAPTPIATVAGNAPFLTATPVWQATITGYTPTTTPPVVGATLGTAFATTATQVYWCGVY